MEVMMLFELKCPTNFGNDEFVEWEVFKDQQHIQVIVMRKPVPVHIQDVGVIATKRNV